MVLVKTQNEHLQGKIASSFLTACSCLSGSAPAADTGDAEQAHEVDDVNQDQLSVPNPQVCRFSV